LFLPKPSLAVVEFAADPPRNNALSRRAAILSRLWLALRLALIGAVFALWTTPSFAIDPLVLFLLKMLRDQVITSAMEAGYEAAKDAYNEPPPAASPPIMLGSPPTVRPGASDSERIRALINESFIHLSPQQREEVDTSFMKIVNDPANAGRRQALIAEFTIQANNLRDAHRLLSQLSDDNMRGLVVQARQEYEKLPPEQQAQMLQVLRRGIPGVPQALNKMMLSEFSSAGG